jgi:hypothetical protein
MFFGDLTLRLGSSGAGGGSSLLTGLVSYWTMDETSGGRSDSTGLNALTDNNTVVGSAGKIGNAADFAVVNNEFLSRIDTDNSLDGGNRDYTYSVWFKTTAAVANSAIFTKSDYNDHGLDLIATGVVRWETGSFTPVYAQSAPGFNDGNWHHVVCWYTAATGIPSMVIDNGSVLAPASPSNFLVNNQPFIVGGTSGGGTLTGSVDELGRWSRLLTSTERTSLWNSGAGRTYPFLGA